MRIGIVSPEFPPELGGMQTYAAAFATELASRGHEVSVFTRQRTAGQVTLPGINVHGVLRGVAAADHAALRRHHADAWHVMNAAYAWVAMEFSPTVVSVHGNDFLRPYIPVGDPDLAAWPGGWRVAAVARPLTTAIGHWRTPRLVRAGLRRAARILTNSRYTEAVFLDRFPECRGRTQAAMVGVGAAFLAEPSAPRAAVPQLITVCRLSEQRKNVDLVLRALGWLKDGYAFHYTVVGDGDQRAELEALAAVEGLAGRVTFTGFLGAAELRRLLAGSDLFVLTAAVNTASHEGFGIAYLEANACGTPTLAARLAGAAEAVDEGRSGFFVRDLTVESLAEAIAGFLRGERRFDPQACRDFASGFGWDRVVDAAVPWYRTEGAA